MSTQKSSHSKDLMDRSKFLTTFYRITFNNYMNT